MEKQMIQLAELSLGRIKLLEARSAEMITLTKRQAEATGPAADASDSPVIGLQPRTSEIQVEAPVYHDISVNDAIHGGGGGEASDSDRNTHNKNDITTSDAHTSHWLFLCAH